MTDFNFEPVAPTVEVIHGYGNPAGEDWVPVILSSATSAGTTPAEPFITEPPTIDRLNPDSPEIDPEHVANLLKAALAAIDRSWFILPMKPYTKEPMACTTNVLGRRRRWQNGVNSFYSASNTDNPEEHCLNEETGDQSPTIATQCWRDGMDANIGLAVGRSDLTVLDYDTGFANQADLHAFEKLFGLPSSWVARSGRVTGYACHVYLKGRMASGSFKIGNVKCDVKSDGGIVAAVGSYHKSGNQYAWESDITQPMAVTPVETLAKLMQEHGGTTKYVPPITSPFTSIDSDDDEDEENGFNPTCEDFKQYFIDQNDEEELVHVGYEQDSEGQWRNDFIRPEGCPRKEGHGDAPPSAYHVYLYDNGKKGAWCFHESCRPVGISRWKDLCNCLDERAGKHIEMGPKIIVSGKSKTSNADPKSKTKEHPGGTDSTASRQSMGKRRVVCTGFDEVEPEGTEYLWRPYVPMGEVTMTSGDPDTAKSWLWLHIAAMVTRGEKFSDFGTEIEQCEPRNVLIIAPEDSFKKTLLPRFISCGGVRSRMFHLDGIAPRSPEDPTEDYVSLTADDVQLIEPFIIEKRPKLFIIDPLGEWGANVNLNVAAHMRSVMSPLKRLVEKYNFAMNITRHNRKSDEGSSAIYKGGGSIDGTAAVRSEIATMNVVKDDEDDPDDSPGLMVYQPTSHFAFVHVKGNLNGKGKGVDYSIRKNKFQIDGLSDKTANDVLHHEDESEELIWLKERLKSGPMPTADFQPAYEAFGFTEFRMRKPKSVLGVKSKNIGGFGSDSMYWTGTAAQLSLLKADYVAKVKAEKGKAEGAGAIQ